MMASPASKDAIVVEVCVKSEHSLGLEGGCIKIEPLLGDDDEPSSYPCVKDEPSNPEVVSEAAAAARLYADHFVEDELVTTSTSVQPRRLLCAAPDQRLLANVKQEKAEPDKIAITPISVKQESKWETEERNMLQSKWEPEMMAASDGEPKNEARGNMPVSHEEVKQELLKCEADACKLNEPQNRMPAPNPLNRNGPMVFKRIWLPDSDFDDAVTDSTPRTPLDAPAKRVAVGSRRVKSPVKRILGSSAPAMVTSQPAQVLVTAIRESRCRKMLEMFPEISPSVSCKMNAGKKKTKYTDVQLQCAISAVKQGMSISEVSQTFCIPKSTLHDKVTKKYPEGATPGAHTVLSQNEEKQLVTWILYLSNVGFPITKHNLIHSVKNLVTNLQRENPFKNGRPGRHWYEGFMSRHPELSTRVSQSLTAPRANITEESIRAWFNRVETYLKNENLEEVLTDPRRIFNCDESAFYLSPKENSVIVKKDSNRVCSRTANDEKECLTVLITVSADVNMQPPLVIFPYKRTPASIILNMPPKWGIGRSESGWMTGETFYEQITNVFYPWLIDNNIPLPVILFMDGHSSYINLPLSEFCQEKKIILIALLPNSTRRLQPLDVAVFRPLKHHWKVQRQTDNSDKQLRKEDFSKALDQCIKDAALSGAIINGFRTCGLFPFDPNNIDYRKLIEQVATSNKKTTEELSTKTTRTIGTLLTEVEMRIPERELEEFRMCGDTWLGDSKNEGLFYFWRKINDECVESTSEETLNANLNKSNEFDLECTTDWLSDTELLNLEVQPDDSIATDLDTQLPSLPENTCEDSNSIEVIALDAQSHCLPENVSEKTTMTNRHLIDGIKSSDTGTPDSVSTT